MAVYQIIEEIDGDGESLFIIEDVNGTEYGYFESRDEAEDFLKELLDDLRNPFAWS